MDRKRRIRLYLVVFISAMAASPMVVTRWWPSLTVHELSFWYRLIATLGLVALIVFAIAAALFGLAAKTRWPVWSQKARRGAALAGASVATVAVVVLVAGFVHGPLPTGSRASRFDTLAWRTSPAFGAGDITPRQKMLADVVEQVLPGKSRKEIEAALGPSEDTDYFAETGRDLIYMTGPERDTIFSIDSEWLLIWLDDSGRFEHYAIVRD